MHTDVSYCVNLYLYSFVHSLVTLQSPIGMTVCLTPNFGVTVAKSKCMIICISVKGQMHGYICPMQMATFASINFSILRKLCHYDETAVCMIVMITLNSCMTMKKSMQFEIKARHDI